MGINQLSFTLPTWGGARAGAGRKSHDVRRGVPHRDRPDIRGLLPVHVTMRVVAAITLRDPLLQPTLEAVLHAARARNGMRIVHYSVQLDHLHLLVEVSSAAALAAAMKGLAVRLARALNRLYGRAGRVWADRYHARVLRTPREARHAVAYVLDNGAHHGVAPRFADPFSSVRSLGMPREGDVVVAPRTWLFRNCLRSQRGAPLQRS